MEEHISVSVIRLMCCFITLCVTDPILGVCCYSYTLVVPNTRNVFFVLKRPTMHGDENQWLDNRELRTGVRTHRSTFTCVWPQDGELIHIRHTCWSKVYCWWAEIRTEIYTQYVMTWWGSQWSHLFRSCKSALSTVWTISHNWPHSGKSLLSQSSRAPLLHPVNKFFTFPWICGWNCYEIFWLF